ncbi:hypothetical protein [Corynebacterium fournieri]|uniref:hypothetical protein n=1 Tax=Corynebacterium fournieri TaxID=1852390 RepID=UPI0015C4814C|nr:hypothetical protein [Corynebacterium fournieri]
MHTVARIGAGLPGATVSATPLAALVAYGWVLAGFLAGRPRATVCAAAACVIVAAAMNQPAAPVDYTGLRAYVVDTAEEAVPVPQWAQLVVVLESGPPKKRPVATRDGIPVIFPNRKGT